MGFQLFIFEEIFMGRLDKDNTRIISGEDMETEIKIEHQQFYSIRKEVYMSYGDDTYLLHFFHRYENNRKFQKKDLVEFLEKRKDKIREEERTQYEEILKWLKEGVEYEIVVRWG